MGDRIRRTEVDGIPVFWTEEPARPVAALHVRAGRADEPLPQAGVCHLIEHLAFHRAGERRFQVNGFVDHMQTAFHASGRADENPAFLMDIVAAILAPDDGRLEKEMRVLRVEAGRRVNGPMDTLLFYRYGSRSLGRMASGEHGLNRLTPDEVRAWSNRWFTAGNAAVWMSTPPPAGFRLPLVAGERMAPPPREAIVPLDLPAWGPGPAGGVSLGAPLPRTTAGGAMTRILRSRAERRLRLDLGLSYEIGGGYLPVDRDEAHVAVGATCRDADATQVGNLLIGIAETLAAEGATPEELADDLDGMERSYADPDAILGELSRAAVQDLLGAEQDTPDQLLAEHRGLTPAAIAEVAELFVARAIAIGPANLSPSARWHAYPVWSQDAVDGRTFDHVSRKRPWSKATRRLVVGRDGVSVLDAEGRPVTVRYASCSGLLVAADGTRVLVGEDGFQAVVKPAEWKSGPAAAALIDAAVDPALRVDLEP